MTPPFSALSAGRLAGDARRPGQGKLTATQQRHQSAPRLRFGKAAIFEPKLEVLDRYVTVMAGEDRDLVQQRTFRIGQSVGRHVTTARERVSEA